MFDYVECYECDKDLTGEHHFTRRREYGDTVVLCEYCDRITPEYRAAGNTRIASFE